MSWETENEDRREFLKKMIFVLGGLLTAGITIPGGVYFLSPAWKKEEEEWVELGDISAIPIGEPVRLEFIQRKKDGWITSEGRANAWVVTADGKDFTVFDPHCTHLGCPYRWDPKKKQFLCPCHNAIFAMNGEVLAGPPPRPLDEYASKIIGDKLLIQPHSLTKKG